jgi:hypothetical protein
MDKYEYFNILINIQDQTLLCRTGTAITHFSGEMINTLLKIEMTGLLNATSLKKKSMTFSKTRTN